MKEKQDPQNRDDAPEERPEYEGDRTTPTTPKEQTGLALPPAGAVSALKIVGTGLPELRLPPNARILHLGSDDHPDIHIRVSSRIAQGDLRASESVSRCHLEIHRKGSRLWILDKNSTNGTFIKDRREPEGEISKFRVNSWLATVWATRGSIETCLTLPGWFEEDVAIQVALARI